MRTTEMLLRTWWNRQKKARRSLEAIAHSWAVACQTAVWESVTPHILTMSYHEARGYTQARAALLLRRRALQLVRSGESLRTDQLAAVRRRAMHRLVTWTVSEAARTRKAHEQRQRRAA